MENKDEIYESFKRYLEGKATVAETYNLLAYFDTKEGNRYLQTLVNETFDDIGEIPPALLKKINTITDRVEQKLHKHLHSEDKTKKIWKPAYTIITIAASIVLALAAYLLLQNIKSERDLLPNYAAIDAEPGSNKATLTLADGRTINLDSAANGTLAQQAGIQIAKTEDGEIIYTVNNNSQQHVGSNTITTPKGGTYQVRLPDGSKVWLNAASTLTYATDLSISNTRVVQLGGEAYFEVAHDKERPFIVKTANQEVEVLGTQFNVNSYTDEGRTITTLAEGSVRVSSFRPQGEISRLGGVTLKPNQEAIQQGENLKVQPADMETALAWKNGNMIFKSATLENIMKQVERWYNVEVVYEGQVRQRIFTGGIPRSSKLSVLLNVLKDSDINFEMKETPQGKVLMIKP